MGIIEKQISMPAYSFLTLSFSIEGPQKQWFSIALELRHGTPARQQEFPWRLNHKQRRVEDLLVYRLENLKPSNRTLLIEIETSPRPTPLPPLKVVIGFQRQASHDLDYKL